MHKKYWKCTKNNIFKNRQRYISIQNFYDFVCKLTKPVKMIRIISLLKWNYTYLKDLMINVLLLLYLIYISLCFVNMKILRIKNANKTKSPRRVVSCLNFRLWSAWKTIVKFWLFYLHFFYKQFYSYYYWLFTNKNVPILLYK